MLRPEAPVFTISNTYPYFLGQEAMQARLESTALHLRRQCEPLQAPSRAPNGCNVGEFITF